jgi:threonine synthase
MIKRAGGTILSVSDKKIIEAQHLMAELEGIFVQPASATTLAGLLEFTKLEKLKGDSTIVMILTGSGLKATQAVSLSSIRVLHSKLSELSRIIKSVLSQAS